MVARRTKPERNSVQVTVRLFGAAQTVSGLKAVMSRLNEQRQEILAGELPGGS